MSVIILRGRKTLIPHPPTHTHTHTHTHTTTTTTTTKPKPYTWTDLADNIFMYSSAEIISTSHNTEKMRFLSSFLPSFRSFFPSFCHFFLFLSYFLFTLKRKRRQHFCLYQLLKVHNWTAWNSPAACVFSCIFNIGISIKSFKKSWYRNYFHEYLRPLWQFDDELEH